mgnify:CR=1 FL=1
MDSGERKEHWETIYCTKAETQVSWFQETAVTSLALLDRIPQHLHIIDVGGGVSRLVDDLVARGYSAVTVLDVSLAALETAKARLGAKAAIVQWIVADITQWIPSISYDAWHDRAVLHFLVNEEDRQAYLHALRRGTHQGSLIVISTFDLDGPEKCSGLPVQRYSPETLATFLGPKFTLLDSHAETHKTPWESEQRFQFSCFIRNA